MRQVVADIPKNPAFFLRAIAQFSYASGQPILRMTALDGWYKHGIVQRLNKKTASVHTDEGQNWKVSPGLLRKTPPR